MVDRLRGLAARVADALGLRGARRRADEEFHFHVDMETEKLVAQGMRPAEARRRARALFGNMERHRAAMGVPLGRWYHDLFADLRYAARALRRAPGLAIAATLTLGVGIGLNGIVFGFVDGMLFRPVPTVHPERLVGLFTTDRGAPNTLGFDDYRDFRDRSGIFADLAAFVGVPLNLEAGAAAADMVWGEMVTPNYFAVLGMRPTLGRFFTAGDSVPGASALAVLSHESWQRRFAGDPTVVGRTVRVNGSRFTIVGVAPPGFRGMRTFSFWPELWTPAAMHDVLWPGKERVTHGRNGGWATTFGRMRDGWSAARTAEAARLFARRLAQTYPETNRDMGALLVPARTSFDNPTFAPPRILTLASSLAVFAVSCVLLVVCANLANLMLARAAARQRELAVRLSLGCSRGRLVRQLLAEAALLAAPGAALGMTALLAGPALERRMVPHLQFRVGIGAAVDHRVLLYTAAISVMAVLLFGLAPALRASRPSLVPALKAARGTAPRSHARGRLGMRAPLVVVQLALSVVLLVGGTLFVRSLRAAREIDLGFDARDRVVVSVNLGLQRYDEARARAFYRDVLARVTALPGVVDASWGFPVPFDTYGRGLRLYVDGIARSPEDQTIVLASSAVAPGFLAAMGIPLVAGRDLSADDSSGAPLRMVVSRAAAARLWPGRDPIGQRARVSGADGPEITVVGVAADAKYLSVSEAPRTYAYVPLDQHFRDQETLVVHTRQPAAAALRQIRGVLAAVDPALPTFGGGTMMQGIDNALNPGQSAASLGAVFGLAALLIAAVGLYALVAYAVAERTRELGVRIALGATPARVRALVVRSAARLGALGLAVGLVGAAGVARVLRGVLYGISPNDPATFVLVPVALGLVVLVASYVPARRATRLDPSAALRE
ncbi:permease (plasmid) [Gemmatirosa kalamazoonensis]|uniref:Permease n=1 Tax=Gemmatirosa kalamazoonensis TaxID=861299 RepID=W0RPP1_9BACT|nr:ABC transporter permease [Gemmatirosa kalamazoonensis]AHG92300.1 permease [Gemmatirosa kalamazoonensis]